MYFHDFPSLYLCIPKIWKPNLNTVLNFLSKALPRQKKYKSKHMFSARSQSHGFCLYIMFITFTSLCTFCSTAYDMSEIRGYYV